ncbi:ATP-dependent DNA helicase [Sanguibacter sp. HDW7]|uniref:ATP-dependent DNA helicase n=1 Tax=Sanguibacter sp. HDW7 TaxID=2714931 RepID=UPI00140A6CAD|nr:ATP-dependent DNA helicase [Sanguibacter sp. HDW7]QIK84116.1 ATP-dependent helicase [Sanguibacter sp. HDW7]
MSPDAPTPRFSAADIADRLGQFRPTDEQTAVIEAPLEPVLVVAGAGSGKTETMSARVVYLVANGLVAPDEVLGLTFTRKAAGELAERIRRRLRTLAAASRADGEAVPWAAAADDDAGAALLGALARPVVATYNSYASGLVREHGLRLGIEPGARLLGEASQWQLAHDIVERWTGELTITSATSTVVDAVRSMSQSLGEHLLPTDEARRRMQAIIDAMLATPEVTKGRKGVRAPVRDLAALLGHRIELLDLVDEYRRRKAATDSLDFSDQVALGARLAEDFGEVGAGERARYRVVLLDEYQDTSFAQARMLGALFGDGHAVTAVGDPHQSIYGWRGASASGLARFGEIFRAGAGLHHLSLSTSWRNDRTVLDAANAVAAPLRRAQEGAGLEVRTLGTRPGAGSGTVASIFTTTEDEEAAAVAEEIAARWRPRSHPDGARSAAVLCRARMQFGPLEAALRALGLPVEVVGLGGLLEAPEVVDLRALLEVVHDPSRGDSLMRLLTGPWVDLGVADLLALADRARDLAHRQRLARRPSVAGDDDREGAGTDAGTTPGEVVPESDASDETTIVDVLDELPPPGWTSHDGRALTPEGHERLVRLAGVVERLRARTYLSVPELVVECERTMGLDIEAGLLGPGHAGRARANLDAFRDLALTFVDGSDLPTLGAFLTWLDATASVNERLDGALTEPDPDAVQIVTVHAAKGLEWDVVAVTGLTDGKFPSTATQATDKDGEAKAPTHTAWLTGLGTLPFPLRGDAPDLPRLAYDSAEDHADMAANLTLFTEDAGEHQVAEERRLAYVAYTRAREHLLLTGSWFRGEAARPNPPSTFLVELVDAGLLAATGWAEPPEGENPTLAAEHTAVWPRGVAVPEALARAARRVEEARVVRRAREAARSSTDDWTVPHDGTGKKAAARPMTEATSSTDATPVTDLAATAAMLLAERELRSRSVTEVDVPSHVSASAMVRMATDRAEYALALRRPVPSAPSVHARRGTTFHAWVEQHFAAPALIDVLDLDDADDEAPDAELDALKETFLATPWADLVPVAIEVDIESPLAGVMTRSRIDAVFPDPEHPGTDRVVVVDWKTGREPRDADAAAAREVQLAVYRLAWARWTGLPLDKVDAAFCYVGSGTTVRPQKLRDESQLEALLRGEA